MPKFVPRIRKQKARQRATVPAAVAANTTDSNVVEIVPVSKDEKEVRRKQLRDEIRAQQPESKASGKKKKRLEKYIDTKLRKEESLNLIKKLAETKVDTSLYRSSKKLGRGKESKREQLGRVLREQRAGVGEDGAEQILFEDRHDEDGDFGSDASSEQSNRISANAPAPDITLPLAPVASSDKTTVSFGSGLKRPLETDESGKPVLTKRQRLSKKAKRCRPSVEEDELPEWEGFGSESGTPDEFSSEPGEEDSEIAGLSDSSDIDHEDSSESHGDDNESSEESSTSLSGDQASTDTRDRAKERASFFKSWATQQRYDALGFTPSTAISPMKLSQDNGGVAAPKQILERDGQTDYNEKTRPAIVKPPEVVASSVRNVYNVPVVRSAEIDEARLALPVVAEEQKIMEVIRNHNCVIICGATGSGKTTQIPQFLFEAGYGSPQSPTPGLIGVTQPRRVAAVSMAKRVATELAGFHDRVAYQIRFDSSVGPKTAVKFMTDGILLREISQDFTLSKYSAIVLDEAHERTVNTDILLGMLTRIVDTRASLSQKNAKYKPLKLIIMSATLSTAEITSNKFLFRDGPPPIVQAEGRQHPVTPHFARRTQRDYLEESFNKISRGHKKLPPGGFLVFLTGQNEIQALAKRLKDKFASTDGPWKSYGNVRVSAADTSIEDEDVELDGQSKNVQDDMSDDESEILGVDNDEDKEFDIGGDPGELVKVHVLPLYSQLPTDQQMRIFQPPPDGSRLIVLATNVAETSLTIPGIRYVFDSGRAKQKHYNANTGVQSFEVDWISKASASQRAGRAGRTGPGHCYRLYSSAVYERDFPDFTEPEITRVPIEGLVLQLKSIGIPNVASFPFPTPPDRQSLLKAERLLEYLGAISDGKITATGNQLSLYPLSPRLARALCQAQLEGVVEHAIALVSSLAAPDVFVTESQLDINEPPPVTDLDSSWTEANNGAALERELRRKEYNAFHANASRLDRASDAIKLLSTVCDFSSASTDNDLQSFRTFSRPKALAEVLQLRKQLSHIVATHLPGTVSANPSQQLPIPSTKQIKALRSIVIAGYIDQVAIRADLSPTPPESSRKPKRAIDVPYITLFSSLIIGAEEAKTYDINDPAVAARLKYVYIHPSSLLAHTATDRLPQYLIYSHLSRGAPSHITAPGGATSKLPPRTRLHPLVPASAEQLTQFARGTPLLEDGKPLGKMEVLERDEKARERRAVLVMPFLKGEGGEAGWPLPPARRVVQVRVPGKGWVDEG